MSFSLLWPGTNIARQAIFIVVSPKRVAGPTDHFNDKVIFITGPAKTIFYWL